MAQAKILEGPKPRKRWKFIYRAGHIDMPFLILLAIIIAIGLATLYSASHVYAFNYNEGNSYYYILRQLFFTALGIVAMYVTSIFDYHEWHKFAWIIWIGSILLLGVVLFLPSASGVRRWIRFAGIQFQPSEVAKFALIILFAHYVSCHYSGIKRPKTGFWPMMGILALTAGLVVIEPHLSGAMLITILGVLLMFIGGVDWKWIVGLGVIGVVGLTAALLSGVYESDRIEVWLHPLETFAKSELIEEYGMTGRDMAWQTVQSLYAIGSGGLLGQGPGNSRQKHLFLPEPQNDFIFSVFCEEVGWIGAVILIILFAVLVWRGFLIGMRARDKFGCMLAIGLTAQVGLQVAINIAVVSNLIPNTGISLPFFSYGGTSLVMLMMQMGIVLSVSRQSRLEKVK